MPSWVYCKECGQQTPEPNTATRGKCDCGAQFYILDLTKDELQELLDSGLSVRDFAKQARKAGRFKRAEGW